MSWMAERPNQRRAGSSRRRTRASSWRSKPTASRKRWVWGNLPAVRRKRRLASLMRLNLSSGRLALVRMMRSVVAASARLAASAAAARSLAARRILACRESVSTPSASRTIASSSSCTTTLGAAGDDVRSVFCAFFSRSPSLRGGSSSSGVVSGGVDTSSFVVDDSTTRPSAARSTRERTDSSSSISIGVPPSRCGGVRRTLCRRRR
mmetsp:Transcript_13155/g.39769  ORF Transcript_13155/g.39769 Transcript_13155/m.39769 type:complete len:207 (+) Transcript_13155:802-1422(+)